MTEQTILQIGLFNYFSFLFPFLLVWTIVYGFLMQIKFFGEKQNGLHAIIALSVAIIISLSDKALQVINYMTPWFILFTLVFFFLMLLFRSGGVKEAEISDVLKERTTVYWLLVMFIIIFLASVSKVYEPETFTVSEGNVSVTVNQSATGGSGEQAFWATLFHPKILGAIFVLLISAVTIKMLAE